MRTSGPKAKRMYRAVLQAQLRRDAVRPERLTIDGSPSRVARGLDKASRFDGSRLGLDTSRRA